MKRMIWFVKWDKLKPRYKATFEVFERVGPTTYQLKLPQELSNVYDVFHVSNIKKWISNDMLTVHLDEIQVNDKLNFIEEPVEIMDRQIKKLK